MFNEICTRILSPPKFKYTLYDLGSTLTKYGKRTDFIVFNQKNQKMNCSFYQPFNFQYQKSCIIYLHSMNGSRLQSLLYVDYILKLGASFCSFDFSGSGNSEGNKITFGANQKYQVQIVLNQLKSKFNLDKFMLWGRSMGAVCAIKYAEMFYDKLKINNNNKKTQIKGIILDSSFKSFSKLLVQIGSTQADIPKFLVTAGYYLIKNSLQAHGQFKMSQLDLIHDSEQELSPISKISEINIPILFLTSKQDKTVSCQHSIQMFNASKSSKKQLKYFKGLHNQSRDQEYINQVLKFIEKHFQLQKQAGLNPIKSLKTFKRNLSNSSNIYLNNQNYLQPKNLLQSNAIQFKQKDSILQIQNILTNKTVNLSKKNSVINLIQRQQLQNKIKMQKQNQYEFDNTETICLCSIFSDSSSILTQIKNSNNIKSVENSKLLKLQGRRSQNFEKYCFDNLNLVDKIEQNLSNFKSISINQKNKQINNKISNNYNGHNKYFQGQKRRSSPNIKQAINQYLNNPIRTSY